MVIKARKRFIYLALANTVTYTYIQNQSIPNIIYFLCSAVKIPTVVFLMYRGSVLYSITLAIKTDLCSRSLL